jgi:selenide,water dikinase
MKAKRAHLVLVGGGHTHVLVLKAIAKSPIYPNAVKVTLVSDQLKAYYSGMLPGSRLTHILGHIAGMYSSEEIEIDLQALCHWARAEFMIATATSMDPSSCTLRLADGREVGYDFISFDVGSTVRGRYAPFARTSLSFLHFSNSISEVRATIL